MVNIDSAILNTRPSAVVLNRPSGHVEGAVRVLTDTAAADANIADVFRFVRIPAGSIIIDATLDISAAAGASVTGDFGYTHVDGQAGDDAAAFVNDADLNSGLHYRKNLGGIVTLVHDAYITCTIAGANFGTAKTLRATVLYIKP
jgi:hypothetical protein